MNGPERAFVSALCSVMLWLTYGHVLLETIISHQIVQLRDECIVAKGNVLLLILTAKSKSSSSGHHLVQSGHLTLNSIQVRSGHGHN